jgi:hypothetical protein
MWLSWGETKNVYKLLVGKWPLKRERWRWKDDRKMDVKELSKSRGRSLSIMTRLRARRPVIDSWQGQGSDFFVTTLRPALGPTQPPMQRALEDFSTGAKRLGR